MGKLVMNTGKTRGILSKPEHGHPDYDLMVLKRKDAKQWYSLE